MRTSNGREQDHPLGAGRRRHRHADPGRPEPVGEHDERRLPRVAGRHGRPPGGREGLHHRRRHHVRQEDVLRRWRPERPHPGEAGERGRADRGQHPDEGADAPHRAARQAGRRGDQRRRARRWPGDRAGDAPPHRRRRQGQPDRPARGDAGPAARRRWRCAHCPIAGHPERAAERPAAGPAPPPAQGAGARPGARSRRHRRGARPRREGVDQGQPRRRRPAVGRQGLQDPRRHAVEPELRGEPAGVPGEPAQADQGREHAGAAGDPGRRDRGRAGRLRHRDHDRDALLHPPRHRPGLEEHDEGVLLRPADHQLRRLAAGRLREVHRSQGRRARRRA